MSEPHVDNKDMNEEEGTYTMSDELRNPELEPENEAAPAADVDEEEEDEDVDTELDVDEEDIPPADELDDEDEFDEEDEEESVFVEGPASFASTREGRRRNPRSVGQEIRMEDINYKNVEVLSRFVDNFGRIYNRRKTRVSAKMQRRVTKAIKRARHLALMPYTYEHIRLTRKR